MEFLNNPSTTLDMSVTALAAREDELHASLKAVVSKIVACWEQALSSDISVVPLTGGISNLLYLITWKAKNERVIVRLYGQGTEMFTDRSTENLIFADLSMREYSPQFLGLFNGGRVEGFLAARALEPDEFHMQEVYAKVATATANLHAFPLHTKIDPNNNRWLWVKGKTFADLAASVNFPTDPAKQAMYDELGLAKITADFKEYEDFVLSQVKISRERFESLRGSTGTEYLRALGSALAYQSVFCHNDLLAGNCLLQEERSSSIPNREVGDITIIDYEYGGYNFRAYDIANHFNEWTGFDLDIVNKFPDRDVRARFIHLYLCEVLNLVQVDMEGVLIPKGESARNPSEVLGLNLSTLSQEEVDALINSFDEVVQVFTIGSHFLWGKINHQNKR